jgi:hypothetical protein
VDKQQWIAKTIKDRELIVQWMQSLIDEETSTTLATNELFQVS